MTQYDTVQYSTVQYSPVHYSTIQYITVRYSTVQYSIVLYITVQYSAHTVQYTTVQTQVKLTQSGAHPRGNNGGRKLSSRDPTRKLPQENNCVKPGVGDTGISNTVLISLIRASIGIVCPVFDRYHTRYYLQNLGNQGLLHSLICPIFDQVIIFLGFI